MNEDARLNEFDKVEWWDVCRKLRPDLTEEQFDVMWREAMRESKARKRRLRLH